MPSPNQASELSGRMHAPIKKIFKCVIDIFNGSKINTCIHKIISDFLGPEESLCLKDFNKLSDSFLQSH